MEPLPLMPPFAGVKEVMSADGSASLRSKGDAALIFVTIEGVEVVLVTLFAAGVSSTDVLP